MFLPKSFAGCFCVTWDKAVEQFGHRDRAFALDATSQHDLWFHVNVNPMIFVHITACFSFIYFIVGEKVLQTTKYSSLFIVHCIRAIANGGQH